MAALSEGEMVERSVEGGWERKAVVVKGGL